MGARWDMVKQLVTKRTRASDMFLAVLALFAWLVLMAYGLGLI